ncbi:MAG: type II toxin-antitoxin system VapC family toxin [Thiotrichaceae bacterium]
MIVLDTHALIWWVNGDKRLSKLAHSAIGSETKNEGLILVSSITTWEIALLVEKKRLFLTMDIDDWLRTVAEIECVKFVPVDNDIAIHSVRLPGEFHPDPADRIITALARQHSVPLITSDSKIRNYQHVKTIW